MRVVSLHVHPVKSIAPVDLDTAEVQPWGLAGDRRWMVVDAHGAQLTAREHHRLLSVTATVAGDGLLLHRPGAEVLRADAAHGARTTVSVWKTPVPTLDAGDEAAAWFTDLLGVPARLAHLDDPTARTITDSWDDPTDVVSFADAFPLLLITRASLDRLNDWIAETRAERCEPAQEPLPARRFRPNVVIDGEVPFVEEGWTDVRIGDVPFAGGGACARCVLTTVDPWTHESGKEPIRTLARTRRWDGATWFGLNLVPRGTGTITVGDPVIASSARVAHNRPS